MIGSVETVVHDGFPVGVVRFDSPMEVLSSAVLNGGDTVASAFFIMQVPKDYHHDDPVAHAASVRDALGLPEDSVGMMTAAEVDYVFNVKGSEYGGVHMDAVATAGLSNQVVAGEVLKNWSERHELSLKRAARMLAGTINIAIISSVPLTMEGKVNLMIPLVEAKSAALADAGYRETGTTSDSMAVFSPIGDDRITYTGTGSDPGIAAARSVRAAVGYALRVRGEHPVIEDPYRVLDGLGYMDRLRYAAMRADSPDPDIVVRRVLSRDDVSSSLDIIMHVSARVDSMSADGDRRARKVLDTVTRGLFGIGLPEEGGLIDAYVEVLASLIRRNEN